MEKIGIIRTFILGLILCCFAVFGLVGCGDPRNGMEITLTAAGDTTISEVDGKLSVSITMGYDEQSNLTKETKAKIVARVNGGAKEVSRRVEVVSSDSTKIACVENSFDNNLKTTTITLQALSPTYDESNIYVDFVCSEASQISKRVYIKIDLPAVGVSAKEGTGTAGVTGVSYYGVQAGSNVSLDPYKLFSFTPAIATVPELTYTINDRSYDDLSTIQIPEREEVLDGYLSLSVHSTKDPDNEQMQATVWLRVYEGIDLSTVYMSREDLLATHGIGIEEIELIKNQTVEGANEALAQINYESNGVDELQFEFSVANGVLNNILAITRAEDKDNQFVVRGATLCTDGVDIDFMISFAGISNSPVYKTSLKIFVVDYPKGFVINGKGGDSLYVANVYDSYSGTTRGTSVQIALTQFSVEKGKYRLDVVTDAGESYLSTEEALSAVQIRVQGQNANYYLSDWDNDEGLVFESGQILLFTLTDGDIIGRVLVRIVSVAIDENDLFETPLTRDFVLSLGKGVTDINLSTTAVDQNTHIVYLQLDTYNAHGNYATKTINYDVLPTLANKLDMTVASSDETVFTTEDVTSSGSFIIRAVAPGRAKIIMTAGSGFRKTFDVQVLNVLGGLATDINVTEQSDIVAESSFQSVKMNENTEQTVRTIKSLTVAQGKPVMIKLNCYPANADIVSVGAESDDTNTVAVLKKTATQIVLTTNNAGTANVSVSVVYDRVNEAGNALYGYGGEKSKRTLEFEIVVYAPISSFEVSSNYAHLYMAGTTSVYDAEKCEITINAIVNPQYSTVKASATKWDLIAANTNETKVLLNGQRTLHATGSSLHISTVSGAAGAPVSIIASIEDKNQIKTQKITLVLEDMIAVNTIKAVNYSAEDSGYFFEESKGFANPGDTEYSQYKEVKTVLTGTSNATPTNTDLEYFLFDANSAYVAQVDNSRIEYQLAGKYCDTAFLDYDAEKKLYRIVPRNVGFAVLYVVPQSVMNFRAETVRNAMTLESLATSSSTKDKVLKLLITVADGIDVPYRIYTVEDFIAIGNEGGLNKNYYLMNSIDFSTYFTNLYNSGQKWKPIGTQSAQFVGSIVPYGNAVVNNSAQNLVLSGLSLREDTMLDEGEEGVDSFGLFGVIGQNAVIRNISFDFSLVSYENNQTELTTTYYGVLAGKNYGKISNVNVSVASMQISGNSNKVMYTGLVGYASMSVTGATEEDRTGWIKSANVTYSSVIINGGNNLDVAFGGLVGYNMKAINDNLAASKSTVVVNLEVLNMNKNSSNTTIGGAVARNGKSGESPSTQSTYAVQQITTSGKINGYYAFAAGGICGSNFGLVENCVSSIQIYDAQNIGGIAGYSQTSCLMTKCAYEAYDTDDGKPNLYRTTILTAETAIGGLVGRVATSKTSGIYYNGAATCCYVKSFADENFVNIKTQGGTSAYVGGLYGVIYNTSLGGSAGDYDIKINKCFVDMNIYVTTDANVRTVFAGGLVGYENNTYSVDLRLAVESSYVLGSIKSEGSNLGLVIGNARDAMLLPYDVYVAAVALEGTTPTHRVMVGGTLDMGIASVNNCYVVVRADTTPTYVNTPVNDAEPSCLVYSAFAEMQYYGMQTLLNADSWSFLLEGNITNQGLPLITVNTEVFYPIIPTYFECSEPYKIIRYNSVEVETLQVYNLVDLYKSLLNEQGIVVGPVGVGLNASNTAVTVESSNPNIVSVLSGVYLSDFRVVLHHSGTVTFTITSTRNRNVQLQVELCVVIDVDDFFVFKSENDAYEIVENVVGGRTTYEYVEDNTKAFVLNADNEFEIKLGQSLEFFVRYSYGDGTLDAVNGGIAIVTQNPDVLKFAGQDFVPYSAQPGYYITMIENASLISVETLSTQLDVEYFFYVYVTGTFRNLTDNSSYITQAMILPEQASDKLKLTISVVNGASDMQVTLGGTEENPSVIEAKDNLSFNVVLTTDSENDKTAGADVVVEIYDETIDEWLRVYDLTLNTITNQAIYNYYSLNADASAFVKEWLLKYKNIELNNDPIGWDEEIVITFDSTTVSRTTTGFAQLFEFFLKDDFVRALQKTLHFRAHFSSFFTAANEFPNTDNIVYTEEDVYWDVSPQGVDALYITHFSDATSKGNYLINAGQRPTNSIVAGEYGLLNIQISPDYAIYDTVIVTSSVSNNDSISFDQRVLVDTQEANTGELITKYKAYETDVHLVDRGISLAKVSSQDESTDEISFDGNFWIRTVVSDTIELGAEFVVTVTVMRDGVVIKQGDLTITVDKVVDIDLSFYSFHESLGAFVAAGTGGSSPLARQDSNGLSYVNNYDRNEIVVTTSGEVNSLSVDIFDDNGSGASIERRSDKYYVVLPKINLNSQLNKQFYVQASATKNVNGVNRTVTKTMKFTVVNFVMAENLRVVNATDGNYIAVYIPDGKYDLYVEEDYKKFSYNQANVGEVTDLFNKLNARNDNINDIINAWQYVSQNVVKPVQYFYATNLTPTVTADKIINDNYYIEWINQNTSGSTEGRVFETGFKIVPTKYGQTETLIFDFTYTYTGGRLVYTGGSEVGFERMTTITLSFVQRSSIENPIPIYTNEELLGMEAGKHYILMNNLNFAATGTYWTPLTTAIGSLNGNGRTITIGNINVTSNTKYGFFETVNQVSVIKNLTICYATTLSTLFVEDLTSFTFGGFAAENHGIISNCVVTRGISGGRYPELKISNNGGLTNSNSQDIAGFVAVNDGDISNSRVENFSLTTEWGRLSGFCVTNDGSIASSYYAGKSDAPGAAEQMAGTLRNNGSLPLSALINTTGFVTYNNGTISGSYVGGAFTQLDENGKTILAQNNSGTILTGSTSRDARIVCSYYASGFVFENSGRIYDSFSAVYINCGNDCCGFVYQNQGLGTAVRCYSVSLLSQSSNSQTPFIGTTRMGTNDIKVNNNNQNKDAFANCFFYDFGCPDIVLRNEVASPLSIAQFINQDGAELSAWQYYSVSRMSGAPDGQEFTGVWTFVQTGNEYFNTEVFSKNFGPQLVSANVIARGDPTDNTYGGLMQTLDTDNTTYDEESGETIYKYNYCVDTKVKVVVDSISHRTYTVFEPYVITSGVDLNALLVNNEGNRNDSWFRLACDIDLSEVKEGTDGTLNTIKTNFCGNFEGNMHTISNIEIVSESQSSNDELIKSDNAGLVAKIYSVVTKDEQTQTIYTDKSLGTMKNLNLELTDISATLVVNVGTLAGTADSAYLFNIDVSGTGAIVIGRNNVGGLVGKLTGTSRVNNISSSVSARAVFGSPDQAADPSIKKGLIYNEDLWRMFVYEDGSFVKRYDEFDRDNLKIINEDKYLAYIGGLFGIIDVMPFEGPDTMDSFNLNSALVSNLKATGQTSVIGGTVGGIAGLVGSSSVVNLATKEIADGAYLNANVFAGGLVGENHGYIRYSEAVYVDSIQTAVNSSNIGEYKDVADFNFFRGQSVAIGGLVGFNYGLTLEGIQTGNIYCSNSRINVVNRSASVAGGAIGVSIGGSSTATLATGTVKGAAYSYIGGLYGAVVTLQSAINNSSGIASLIGNTFLVDPYIITGTSVEAVNFNSTIKPTLIEQPALATYSVAMNNWAAKDYSYFYGIALLDDKGYIGGFAGYVSDEGDALTVIHSSHEPIGSELDRIDPSRIEYSSETNFYVNKIYDKVVSKGTVEANNSEIALASGTHTMTLAAVGSKVTYRDEFDNGNITYEESLNMVDYAKGLNRHYMQSENGQTRMYGNWARYSFSRDENGNFTYDEYGSVTFNRETVPDTVEISSVGDIRSVMAWELNAKYVLVNDIDCDNESFVLGQLDSPFTGKFDGNGYMVYNYNLKGTNALAVGFFAYTKGAEIVNLKLYNFKIKAYNSTSSISQVGLLVGKAIDTTMDKVEIIDRINDIDDPVISTIETNYMYVGTLAGYVYTDDVTVQSSYTRNFAYGNINVSASNKREMAVGGLFGFVEGAIGEVTQNISNRAPANVNYVAPNNTITMENNGFTGNVYVESSSNGLRIGGFAGAVIDATMIQNFAYANVEGKNITDGNNQDNPNNTSRRYGLFAGAYSGYIEGSFISNAAAEGELYISTGYGMADLKQPINIGGLGGYVSATVWTSFVAPNISFISQDSWTLSSETQNSVVDYSQESATVNNKQNIGGFAGVWRGDHEYQYYNILSATTIFNATTLSRVDSWAFARDQNIATNFPYTFLVADTFVSNVSSNNFEAKGVRMVNTGTLLLPEESTGGYAGVVDVVSGEKNTFYSRKNVGMYPAVIMYAPTIAEDVTELTGTCFEKVYKGYFVNGTLLSEGAKTKPIMLATTAEISEAVKNSANSDYKFYYCSQEDWQRSLIYLDSNDYVAPYGEQYYEENVNTNYDFYGFFNGSQIKIKQVTSYDYLFGAANKYAVYAKTPKFGVFDEILDKSRNTNAAKVPYGSVVSGVNLSGVALSYVSSATTDVNIGLIACGEVGRNSYIFGCSTSGYVEYTYNTSGKTVNIGGIAADCKGQINSCSSSVDIISTGSATYNVGGLVAKLQSVDSSGHDPIYGLVNCYYNGSIINNAANARVGGVVARAVGSLNNAHAPGMLFARNVYTIGTIKNSGGASVVFNTFIADQEMYSGGQYVLNDSANPTLASVSGKLYYESTTVDSSRRALSKELVGISPFATLSHRSEGGRDYNTYTNYYKHVGDDAYETSAERPGSLAADLGSGVWVSLDKYNYAYPVLAYTQVVNPVTDLVEETGSGTEADPYILRNEGSLVWALKYNIAGKYYQIDSNFEYSKITGLISLLNETREGADLLNLENFTFKGHLDGRGHTITGSTGVLLGTINSGASVSSIKFAGISGTNGTMLAKTNNGTVLDCYLANSSNTNCLVTTNVGTILDSFTEGASFSKTNNGSQNRCFRSSDVSSLNTYDKCMTTGLADGMDFYRIWAFIPNNASVNQSSVTGTVTLRSFIDNWSNKDLSAVSFPEYTINDVTITTDSNAITTISGIEVKSIDSLVRIDQYIKRNSAISFTFNLTITSGLAMNFEGKRIDPIGGTSRSYSNANIILDGQGATIYNAYFDDITNRGVAGLFAHLGTTSSITNLSFNNVTVSSEGYAGALAAVSQSTNISDVSISNSWVVCSGNVAGALLGQNNGGKLTHCTVDNCCIDGLGNTTGGMIGLNTGNSQGIVNDNFGSTAEGRFNTVNNSLINNYASQAATKNVNMTEVGGFVGANRLAGSGSDHRANSINGVKITGITKVNGFSNTGGVVGYSEAKVLSASLHVGAKAVTTFSVGSQSPENIGGLVGFLDGSAAVFDIALDTPEVYGSTFWADINASTADGVGCLVGKALDASIRNSYTEYESNSTILLNGNAFVGGIVGLATNTTIGAASNEVKAEGLRITANRYVGGIVGRVNAPEGDASYLESITPTVMDYVTAKNCQINATASYVGGIVGLFRDENGSIKCAVSTYNTITGGSYIGGAVGGGYGQFNGYMPVVEGQDGAVAKVEQTTITATGDYVGGLVGYSYFDSVSYATLRKVSVTSTKSAVSGVGGVFGVLEPNATNVNVSSVKVEGSNQDKNYVTASTGASFYIGGYAGAINRKPSYTVSVTLPTLRYVEVTANGASTYVGGFTGSCYALNVSGKTGFNQATSEQNDALSIIVTGGVSHVGGFAGYIDQTTVAYGMYGVKLIASNGRSNRNYVGGFAGESSGTINRASVINGGGTSDKLTIQANEYVGGFVGVNHGSITNAHLTNTDIEAGKYVGGFVGKNNTGASVTSSSYESGSIMYYSDETALLGMIGGFVGHNLGSVTSSGVNIGDINFGGAASKPHAGTYADVGGFAGLNDTGATLENITATTANVYGYENVGGVVGHNKGTLTATSLTTITGSIYAQGVVGGIVGYNDGTVAKYRSNSGVTGFFCDGNYAFATKTLTSTAYANGQKGSTYCIGGVVGYNSKTGTITDCSAGGTYTGGSMMGGIAGVNAGIIERASLTQAITLYVYASTFFDATFTGQGSYGALTNMTSDVAQHTSTANYVPAWLRIDYSIGSKKNSIYNIFYGNYSLSSGAGSNYNNTVFAKNANIMLQNTSENAKYAGYACIPIGVGALAGIQCNKNSSQTGSSQINANTCLTYTGTVSVSSSSQTYTTYQSTAGVWINFVPLSTGSAMVGNDDSTQTTPWIANEVTKVS